MTRRAASILNADFSFLADQIRLAQEAGVDWIHLDVMDGLFVPNLSFGLPVVAAVRRVTRLPLDLHLMIERPERYLDDFVAAGADWLTVHVEGAVHLHRTLSRIRELGARAGVTLNPATPAAALEEALDVADLVLVMTVNPGFGGQRFIDSQLRKIAILRAMIDSRHSRADLSVDGGVNAENVGSVVAAGADVIVAGSALFNERQSVAEAVAALRAGMERGDGGTGR